jgi:hypothetical protein
MLTLPKNDTKRKKKKKHIPHCPQAILYFFLLSVDDIQSSPS